MDKYLSRNQKIILKKYNKHVILPKNSQTRPSELRRTRQIYKIFKLPHIFGPFHGDKTFLGTNISQEIKRWPPKSILSILYYKERAQKEVRFRILCSFDPFCSILWTRSTIFWKFNLSKIPFWVVLGVNFWFLDKYLSLNMLFYQQRAQKAVIFWILCCFHLLCSIPRACLAIFLDIKHIKWHILGCFGVDI